VVDAALELAEKIGGFAAEDELTDPVYVEDLSSVILSVAPHTALMKAFHEFETLSEKGPVDLARMQTLFQHSRIAELASYGQIARERVRAIESLETIVRNTAEEGEFQQLIASAPWLVEPTWSIISENEALNTFKTAFEQWYKQKFGEEVLLAIRHERKRPDFTLVDIGGRLYIVEIKSSGHSFDDKDAERLFNYADAFDQFFANHPSVRTAFPLGFQITLVADFEKLRHANNKLSYQALIKDEKLRRIPWMEFLFRAKKSHEQFLKVARVLRQADKDGAA
jgi:hypothetical protein